MVVAYDTMPLEGFEPEIGLLLATLEGGTREWREELGDVSHAEIARRPFEGGPSIGALLLHAAEAEAWWIDEVVGGRPLTPEFKFRTLSGETDVDSGVWGDAPEMPLDAYFEILDEVRYRTRETLHDELPNRHVLPDPNRPGMTVRWVLGHVVQHESYHGGQAVMLKRMLRGSV